MNLARFNELKNEVGEWSAANFGDNGLGKWKFIRPALGVLEEYEEWSDALVLGDADKEIDALADIGIYLLDLCYQLEIDVPDYSIISSVPHKKLPRTLLKRIQGIRGYADDVYFFEQMTGVIKDWFALVENMAADHGLTCLEIIEKTWAETVSKRDWKKNKETGV